MKALLVQKMAGISGSERYLLAILPAIRSAGVDAAFLIVQHPRNASKNQEFAESLRSAGVPLHVINTRLPISPWLIWNIAKLVRRERIEVMHTNLIHADVWGALVRCLFVPRLRLVSVKHGYSESFQTQHGLNPELVRKDVTSILTRWAARQAERVVCISSALQTFLTRSGLVPADKAVTIPYGFDFSGVPSLEPRGSLRFGNPQIVVPGRVVPVKQHHLLIEVLPALMTEFPTMSVVMVGGGPLLNSLRARTVALRLGDRVRWEGFRPNMHDYLRDSDLVVIPSAAEGFGLVVLEAWYQGKPVVAFDVPALNEIVESGVDGELVPPFDQGSLVETLRRLLSSAALRQVQGDAGQRKQVERYGLRAMTTATVEVMRPSAA